MAIGAGSTPDELSALPMIDQAAKAAQVEEPIQSSTLAARFKRQEDDLCGAAGGEYLRQAREVGVSRRIRGRINIPYGGRLSGLVASWSLFISLLSLPVHARVTQRAVSETERRGMSSSTT
ncbi:hypothetical protein [Nonomuraea sp. LPB2021202275-12-8]|uniref:hypothetical protein n=1 Tax=Nonomuraea sp. LPB2021202275-12-8 TaxID=3120159 RepID=UPI00300D490F